MQDFVETLVFLKVCSTTSASLLQLSETSQGCVVLRGQSCLSLMQCKSELRALRNPQALPDGSDLSSSLGLRSSHMLTTFRKISLAAVSVSNTHIYASPEAGQPSGQP